MSDLLTDEDIRTRHEPPKGYFNQYVTVYHDGCVCLDCGRTLSEEPGQIFFSCCPATFATLDEALEHTECNDCIDGETLADYMGTFEL